MERHVKLIAEHLRNIPPSAQDQVKALLYDERLSFDKEQYFGREGGWEWERRAIRNKICRIITRYNPKHMSFFRWYGGKVSHLDFILPLLPEAHTYIEPYAGSASVLLNRVPSRTEVLNDLDEELINFFRVLRDDGDRLIEKLELTPYSRREYEEAIAPVRDLDDLERARRFYCRASQVRNGLAQCARPSNWSYPRHGVNKNLEGKLTKVAYLPLVVERLSHVTLECLPALEVIARHDSPKSLTYVDSPYVWSARTRHGGAYHTEMSDEGHRQQGAVLNACTGKVAISGYDTELYDELYKGWYRHAERPKRKPSGYRTSQEILWTNYPV